MKLLIWDVGEGARAGGPQEGHPRARRGQGGSVLSVPLGHSVLFRSAQDSGEGLNSCLGCSSVGRAVVAFCGAVGCGWRGFFVGCDHGSLPWPVPVTVTMAMTMTVACDHGRGCDCDHDRDQCLCPWPVAVSMS